MKPLNTKERDSAFWRFALSFLIALSVIMVAIYFSFIIPHKQFAELKSKVKDYNIFMAKQKGFMSQIDTINSELRQYNVPGANQSYLLNDISKKNITLKESIGDENETNRIYHKIIDNYNVMLGLKDKLNQAKIQLTQANKELGDCEDENRKVEKELKEKQEKSNK